MQLFRHISLLTAVAVCLTGHPAAAADDLRITADQGTLALTTATGAPRPDSQIIGREILIGTQTQGYRARIDGIETDPHAAQPLKLYDVSFLNTKTGMWEPLCNPGPFGLARAVPVSGGWTRDGRFMPASDDRFTFNCTSGAHVKCLRLGYAPWAIGPDGASLTPKHQACTRMMRADYCGTGQPFTVPGRQIQILDRARGLPERLFGRLEAIWGENGAICLARSRVPKEFPLSEILKACPRLAEIPAEQCTAEVLEAHPAAVLGNRP